MSAAEYSELTRAVHSIEVKLTAMDGKLDRAVKDGTDHEGRLRALEAFRWKAVGIATVVGAGASLIIDRLLG